MNKFNFLLYVFIQNLPNTTYQAFAAQTKLKDNFTEREVRKPMVNLETLDHVDMER